MLDRDAKRNIQYLHKDTRISFQIFILLFCFVVCKKLNRVNLEIFIGSQALVVWEKIISNRGGKIK